MKCIRNVIQFLKKEGKKIMKRIIDINGIKHQFYQNGKKSLLLVYPGVGYTGDKPLLYYGIQCALQNDYDVCVFSYGNLSFDIHHPMAYVQQASLQVQAMLQQLDVSQYDRIICLAKSIGTMIAYETTSHLKCSYFMLTPLKEVLHYHPHKNDILLCASDDPLVASSDIEMMKHSNAQVYILKGNHSLECGNVQEDLWQLQYIIQLFLEYVK